MPEAQSDLHHTTAHTASEPGSTGLVDDAPAAAGFALGAGPIPGVAADPADGAPRDTNAPAKVPAASASDRAYGTPLPASIRGDLERALGADLGAVRLHAGPGSSRTATALGAPAFAHGNDIHFAGGVPDLSSVHARHMVAHEVAHTVQQGSAAPRKGSTPVSGRGDPAEREAAHFADAFVVGAPTAGIVTAGMRPDAAIHCYGYDEHHDIPTKYLTDLRGFLATPDGEAWARKHGYNAAALLAKMQTDPAANGEKLHGTSKANPGGKATEFDYGDPTAMYGDLFDDTSKLRGISQQTHDDLGHAKSDADYQRLTGGKYLDLAKKNDEHYAGRNLDSWKKYHHRALELAASKNQRDYDEALFVEASGAHFMTDAFAAGHQFVKADLLAAVLLDLQRQPLFATNRQMQTYVLMLGTSNLAQVILKLVHDRMNEEGFEVTNDKQMTWRTYGDGYLSRSVENQRIAALAVFESRQQVIAAHQTGTVPAMDDVAAFFPNQATQQAALQKGIAYLPQARSEVEALIVAQRGAAPGEIGSRAGKVPVIGPVLGPLGRGVGHVVESNLDAIGDPGRERNYHLNEDLDNAHGTRHGSGEGSFTLKRF